MPAPSLSQAIAEAGSPIRLVWNPTADTWKVPVVAPEYAGWAEEQRAWRETCAVSDLSHHMADLFIDGPEATQLLMDFSANDYETFEIGQAKQFVPVMSDGNIITDGILMRTGAQAYTLSGVPACQTWIQYQAERHGYNVSLKTDPDSRFRGGADPVLFRLQIQGPKALEVVETVFGGPLPKVKFFHSCAVTLDGRSFRALRHGMAGMPGYEFIGPYEHCDHVKAALMAAGEPHGIVHVGGLAYYTNGIESGWIPTPTPAIFTDEDPDAAGYRDQLSKFSYEGQKPLHGSFYSDDIRDYYVSPFELGYGRSIAFTHDFHGRAALEAAKGKTPRTKVTLDLDPAQSAATLGGFGDYFLTYGRYRIEVDGKLVGMTFYTGYIAPLKRILALSLIDNAFATPGTQVDFVWGEHPGPGTARDGDLGFVRIRATVQLSPYNEHARTDYRKD